MAIIVAIVGDSGSGKSTSIFKEEKLGIEGLNPKDTFIFNVSGKPLPVRKGDILFPNEGKISETRRQFKNCDAVSISKFMIDISEKVKVIRNMVVDDAQFLQAFKFMSTLKEKGLIS